jgi:hypothetical protein
MRNWTGATGDQIFQILLDCSGATFAKICGELGLDPRADHPGFMAVLDFLVEAADVGLITIDGIASGQYTRGPEDSGTEAWKRITETILAIARSAPEEQPRIRASMQYIKSKELIMGPVLAGYRDGNYSFLASPVFGPPLDLRQRYDVFVLMPFKPELDVVYQDHVKPTVEKLDLTVMRADELHTSNSIMKDVWSSIYRAGVIIADCTGCNPNVFYELGIAHTVGIPVVIIVQDMQSIPFDLRHLRCVEYAYTPRGMTVFQEKLKSSIQNILKL